MSICTYWSIMWLHFLTSSRWMVVVVDICRNSDLSYFIDLSRRSTIFRWAWRGGSARLFAAKFKPPRRNLRETWTLNNSWSINGGLRYCVFYEVCKNNTHAHATSNRPPFLPFLKACGGGLWRCGGGLWRRPVTSCVNCIRLSSLYMLLPINVIYRISLITWRPWKDRAIK